MVSTAVPESRAIRKLIEKRLKSVSHQACEVKSPSLTDRFVIASASPWNFDEVGLLIAASEKKAGLVRAAATVVRSLKCGLSSENRRNQA
jgi:hypothetical protein